MQVDPPPSPTSQSVPLPIALFLLTLVAIAAMLVIGQVQRTIQSGAADAENYAADWERAERVWKDPTLSPKEREKVFNPNDGLEPIRLPPAVLQAMRAN